MKNASFDLIKRCQRVKGLSYVEVMVSMITSAIFLSTTLQAYVAATGIRARSQQINTAISNIQEDTESIRQMAQTLPQTAVDCQLSSSDSYAQQIMKTLIAREDTKDTDAADHNASLQPQSSQPVMSANEQREEQFVLQQSSTLPTSGLPDGYKLHRVLLVDKSFPPSAQVLQISYKVIRHSTHSQLEEDADRSQTLQLQSEIPLAQLHTSVIPNAALVCF